MPPAFPFGSPGVNYRRPFRSQPMNRRDLLRTALAAGALGALTQPRSPAIEPIARPGPARLKLSLAAYSFNKLMDLRKGKKPAMTQEQFIDLAAGYGLGAVELTQYYFPETAPGYLAAIKGRCTRLGLDVSGTAVGNNFCVTDPAKLREQIDSVKQWAEHTARLGGKTMRIFAGNLAKGDTEEAARKRCVEAIQESCDHAGKVGVYLALENHGGIVATAEQLLAIVTAVKHDWFGVNLDTGNFRTPDPYADVAKAAPYAVTVQIKVEVQRPGQPKEAADLRRVVDILRQARYRGYVALEYEASEDPMKAVPRHLETLKELMKS
jgi:sugar phosphate isomerase/epimerase